MPTTPAWMTHDCVQHGTINLFAAFDVGRGGRRLDARRGQRPPVHLDERRSRRWLRGRPVVDLGMRLVDSTWSNQRQSSRAG
jgi:hypothetical protein